MTVAKQKNTLFCARCLFRWSKLSALPFYHEFIHSYSTRSSPLPQDHGEAAGPEEVERKEEEHGRMSQRLSQMTEESIEQGGRSIKKAIEEGGFSEDLKKQLEARIQNNTFRSENPAAFAEINMPVRLLFRRYHSGVWPTSW